MSSVKSESETTGWRRDEYESERQTKTGAASVQPPTQDEEQGTADRRALRSQYLTLINKFNGDSKSDLKTIDSDNFKRIINEVENLHQKVQKPREQIADAEALLDLANTLVSSVKSQSVHGVSPAEFVNALICGFGESSLGIDDAIAGENKQVSMKWKDIGFAFCSTVMVSSGCSTMMGSMDTELKRRKRTVNNRKRTKHDASVKPEEVDDTQVEKKTDTDNNMSIMFNILRKNKHVKIENLVLNRRSFAQTVENLFALSFLVKDGRVQIIVDKNGSHFAVPRNAPASNLVMSGEVVYNHFVFRYDYKDWELTNAMVAVGEELMPHRETKVASYACDFASKQVSQDSIVEDSPDIGSNNEDIKFGATHRTSKLRRFTCEDGS